MITLKTVKRMEASKRIRRLAALLALLFFVFAGGQIAAQNGALPKVEFEKYTLANGLQVILHVDRKLPMVHVNQWFHAGSKNEKPGRTGFAHLFEHMMFQGSKNAPGEYVSYVENAGANIFEGGVNGTTNNDRTNYFVTVPSANLELILWLESDRLATLPEALTQVKLDNQRDVVKNERRQGLENQPYGRAALPGAVQQITRADVAKFHETYWKPGSSALIFVGEVTLAEATELAKRALGDWSGGAAQQFEAHGRIARQIAELWAAGLPMSELQKENDETEKATLAAVNASAQKYAAPNQSTLLLVGDLSKIEAGIRELNLGEVVILNTEGKPAGKK